MQVRRLDGRVARRHNRQTRSPNGTSYIGVGDSTTAFLSAQTDLQGTKVRKNVDGGFPGITASNVLSFRGNVFNKPRQPSCSEANGGIFNAAASSGTMLNRKVESLGTRDKRSKLADNLCAHSQQPVIINITQEGNKPHGSNI